MSTGIPLITRFVCKNMFHWPMANQFWGPRPVVEMSGDEVMNVAWYHTFVRESWIERRSGMVVMGTREHDERTEMSEEEIITLGMTRPGWRSLRASFN